MRPLVDYAHPPARVGQFARGHAAGIADAYDKGISNHLFPPTYHSGERLPPQLFVEKRAYPVPPDTFD